MGMHRVIPVIILVLDFSGPAVDALPQPRAWQQGCRWLCWGQRLSPVRGAAQAVGVAPLPRSVMPARRDRLAAAARKAGRLTRQPAGAACRLPGETTRPAELAHPFLSAAAPTDDRTHTETAASGGQPSQRPSKAFPQITPDHAPQSFRTTVGKEKAGGPGPPSKKAFHRTGSTANS